MVGGSCKSTGLLIIGGFLIPLCGWKWINYVNAYCPHFMYGPWGTLLKDPKRWGNDLFFFKRVTVFNLIFQTRKNTKTDFLLLFFSFLSHNFNVLRTRNPFESQLLLRTRIEIQWWFEKTFSTIISGAILRVQTQRACGPGFWQVFHYRVEFLDLGRLLHPPADTGGGT